MRTKGAFVKRAKANLAIRAGLKRGKSRVSLRIKRGQSNGDQAEKTGLFEPEADSRTIRLRAYQIYLEHVARPANEQSPLGS